ncbi:baseplate J/gp47 family protein [Acetobacter orientalis]|uniref:baseplate J/gp47 family protein n=1 Tax=Acetobacter orientalis TaxID=146474 RepID=UPI0039EB909D
MPYARPTLTQLRQQALQDVLDGGITNVSAVLRFSVISVICYALAGLSYLHYGYLDWIAKQAVPWTATDEYLAGWAAFKGIYRKDASVASGTVSFTVTGTGTIPAGTGVALAGGLLANTTAESTTANGISTAPATCTTAGAAGNVAAGSVATLSSPVPGIQTVGQVATSFTGGADIEEEEDFRSRMLVAWQTDAANGKYQDYIDWALAVPGVTRAWINPLGFGAGTVVVYVMLDNANTASNGFPVGTNGARAGDTRYTTATGDQLTVANALFPSQPVDALVIICAPVAQPVDFSITDLGTDNTAANQAQIKEALADMFRRLSAPGGTIHPNNWEEALSALGLKTFNVASPTAPVTGANAGAMPTLGAVTFES